MGTRPTGDPAADELEFELVAFDHLVETARGHILRVAGRWTRAGQSTPLPHPSLVIDAGGGDPAVISPLPMPGHAPPHPDGETEWRANYSVPKDRFVGGRAPDCLLRVAPTIVFPLPELVLPDQLEQASSRPPVGARPTPAIAPSRPEPSAPRSPRSFDDDDRPAPVAPGRPAPAPPGLLEVIFTAVRAHRRIVGGIVLLALVGAVLGTLIRSPTYTAEAQLVVKPLPSEDVTLADLPDVRAGSDPENTIQTAAALIRSRAVATETARRLGGGEWTARRVLRKVALEPVSGGNLLSVTATDDDGPTTARLANTFARTAVEVRDSRLRRLAGVRLESARSQLAGVDDPNSPQAQALELRIAALRQIQDVPQATLSVASEARVPRSAAGLPALAVIILTALAGLVLGAGAAVVADLVGGRRVASIDDVVGIYPLPVLARVPTVRGKTGRGQTPARSPGLREAFRTLQVQLELQSGVHETIMFTSASAGDGKTTSAMAFAIELAESGQRVVLIDLDLRKPDVASRLGLRVEHTIGDVVGGRVALADALVPVPGSQGLHVLGASGPVPMAAVGAIGRGLDAVIHEAEELADFIVLDTAPVGEVSDALTFARTADDVLLVCRLGRTAEVQLRTAGELLDRTQITPTGLVVVTPGPGRG